MFYSLLMLKRVYIIYYTDHGIPYGYVHITLYIYHYMDIVSIYAIHKLFTALLR